MRISLVLTLTGQVYSNEGEDLSDRIMMVYPAGAAQTYLDLFNKSSELPGGLVRARERFAAWRRTRTQGIPITTVHAY